MQQQVDYTHFSATCDRLFEAEMQNLRLEAEISALQFELKLAKRIHESLARLNMQVLSGC
jgi:hypothetical protein